ncbi:MAG: SIMPL domain-containing protein [Chloroflexota bacterium]
MRTFLKTLFVISAMLALMITGVSAQETDSVDNTERTITVTGNGSAFGDPDIAVIVLGVEQSSTSISEAYANVNTRLDAIVADLTALGIAENDIQTMDLNIFTNQGIGSMGGASQVEYFVSNRISVIVRDLEMLENVIDTAVSEGANNVFGLNFLISDTSELEATARIDALDQARDRAQQIADALGVELGQVQTVVEDGGSFVRSSAESTEMAMGGGNATIERGQLSVSVSVRVTYSIAD